MSPPGVPNQLRQLIHYHLDNGFYDNALFLAGRLHALDPRNQEYAHLLALCNLRLGRYKAAHDAAKLRNHHWSHLGCAFVFAHACLALERHEPGAVALEKTRGQWVGRSHWNKHSDTSKRHLPDAAACHALLGKLWSAHGDIDKAAEYYIKALELNPFMWDAFTDLCDLGFAVRPTKIFKVTPEMLAAISHAASNGNSAVNFAPQESQESRNPFVVTPDVDPFNPSLRNGGDVGLNLGGSNLLSKLNGSMPSMGSSYMDAGTPTFGMPDDDTMLGDTGGPVMDEHTVNMPPAPGRKARLQPFNTTEEPPRMRPITSRIRQKMSSESEVTDIPRPVGQNGHKRTVSGHSLHHTQTAPASTAPPTIPQVRRSARVLKKTKEGISQLSGQLRPSSSSRHGSVPSREPEVTERRTLRRVRETGIKGKPGTVSQVGRVVSGNRKPAIEVSEATIKPEPRAPGLSAANMGPPGRMASSNDAGRDHRASLEWLLDLLLKFGTGYKQLSRYECIQALETFSTIPTQQRETPWVLAQIGKAYYERSQYPDAEKIFNRIREKAPSYLEDMEVFSNVLWHLKKETDLSYLAHTLMDQDRLSPQAWCAIGNAFSLERDHDQAIKCFTRATQLDQKFAYAFTLQGHEHVANEEYDKAMFAYRCAVSADNRHYNGWYGLGSVYERMAKFDIAEKHYRNAALINPSNAILAVKIGEMLYRTGKTQAALHQFTSALNIDSRCTRALYQMGRMNYKLGQLDEALRDLEQLRDLEPEDSNAHKTLAKAYKRLGRKTDALRHFTIALNLDPRAHLNLKEHMENLDNDEESVESSDDGR